MRRYWVSAVVAVTLVAGCGGSSAPTAGKAPSPSTATPLGYAQLDGDPYGVEAVGDMVWVEAGSEATGPELVRIDPATRKVVARVPGASLPVRVAAELWYVAGPKTLARADPGTGKPIAKLAVADTGHFAVDGGTIWIASGETSGQLSRVDLRTGRTLSRLALPAGEPKDLLVYAGAVWVAVDGANVVVKVDATSGRQVAAVKAGDRPHSLAAGFGAIWVIDHGESALQRIDAGTAKVVATIPDAGINVAVTATGDAVWAASSTGLVRIDPATNKVTKTAVIEGSPELYDVTASGSSLWVTSVGERRVYEVAAS